LGRDSWGWKTHEWRVICEQLGRVMRDQKRISLGNKRLGVGSLLRLDFRVRKHFGLVKLTSLLFIERDWKNGRN